MSFCIPVNQPDSFPLELELLLRVPQIPEWEQIMEGLKFTKSGFQMVFFPLAVTKPSALCWELSQGV